MIAHDFSLNEERAELADYLQILPMGKVLSVLSSPQFVEERNMFKLFNGFTIEVWILLLLSFVMVVSLNVLKINNWNLKFSTVIDYLAILIGKGIFFVENNFLVRTFS
jgi:hypothetical protein